MQAIRRAVIDVGTNSIKLLLADVVGQQVQPLVEDSKQTRLGHGFYATHRLRPEAISATADAVAHFADVARQHQAASIRAIATSAARDALNQAELIAAIETRSGLKVEVISGEQEADWVFKGVTTDPELAHQPLLLLDVGGGSTEFVLGHGGHKHFQQSLPLGSVRLLEKFPQDDPPKPEELAICRRWLKEFLQQSVRPQLEPAMKRELQTSSGAREIKLVGTGGSASILARVAGKLETFDRARIEGTRLSSEQLTLQVDRLWKLPLAQRQQIVGLPPNRADVILPGAAIYEAVLIEFGFGELRISTRGLRFAAVMEG